MERDEAQDEGERSYLWRRPPEEIERRFQLLVEEMESWRRKKVISLAPLVLP